MNNTKLMFKETSSVSSTRQSVKTSLKFDPFVELPKFHKEVFVLDTCYLIRLARSGYGVYTTLKQLSEKGDVIVTRQVVDEFQRNAQTKRDIKKEDVAELYRAINEGIVSQENIAVSKEEHQELSRRMQEKSHKKNRRLGLGDASIAILTDVLKGLYQKINIISEDSDLFVLLPTSEGVNIRSFF
ncbi:MAG: hypothetical protein QXT45_03705 [Candidatus Bilamarchaeaceae archaeon]